MNSRQIFVGVVGVLAVVFGTLPLVHVETAMISDGSEPVFPRLHMPLLREFLEVSRYNSIRHWR